MGARVVRRRCRECARPSVVAEAATVKFAGHPVSGVVPFCVGWRLVVHGTPTLTEWPMPFFVFPDSGVVPFCVGWRPVAYGTPTLTEWPAPSFFCFSCFSPSSCLISRPSGKSRMRCPDLRGRESWDWAEQNSLYKKNSPHKVGEETFVRMGARWRKQSGSSPR